tara:strand:- start:438 stop:914 length:477 start_codon:yes stop_codon:yes gene_type:complete
MKNKNILNIILFISIFSLGSAYFIEYILGFSACNLCLIERIPYFLALLVILIGFFLNRFEKFILISLGFIFLCATILSFYHVGIEQGFFEESLACISNNDESLLNKKDLLKEIQNAKISCKDVDFTLFGLSLATINTIISLILSVISIRLFINYDKNR